MQPTALGALLALLIALPTSSQDTPQEAPWYRIDGEEIVFEPTGPERELRRNAPSLWDLVKLTRQITGIDFYTAKETDEARLKRESFQLLDRKRIPKARMYEFLQSALRAHHQAVVEIGSDPLRLVRIVGLDGPGMMAVKTNAPFIHPAEIEVYRYRPATLVVTILPLEHLAPADAIVMLEHFFTSQSLETFAPAGVDEEGRSRTGRKGLMVIAFGDTVYAIQELLRTVDVPPKPEAEREVILECEIWSIAEEGLRKRIEALSAAGDAGLAPLRQLLASTAGCRQEARLRGPVAEGEKIFSGAEGVVTGGGKGRGEATRIAIETGITARCAAACAGESRVAMEIVFSRTPVGEEAPLSVTRIESQVILTHGRTRLLQSRGPDGTLVLALLRASRP